MLTILLTKLQKMKSKIIQKPIKKRLSTVLNVKSLVVEVLGALIVSRCLILLLLRERGLEPPHLVALDPKSSASTSSATLATAFI